MPSPLRIFAFSLVLGHSNFNNTLFQWFSGFLGHPVCLQKQRYQKKFSLSSYILRRGPPWKIIIKFAVPPSGAIHPCATSKEIILYYDDVLSCCDSLVVYYTTFICFLFSYFSIYKVLKINL